MDKEDNKRFHTFGGENKDFIKRESMSSIKDDGFCLAHGHLSDDGQLRRMSGEGQNLKRQTRSYQTGCSPELSSKFLLSKKA